MSLLPHLIWAGVAVYAIQQISKLLGRNVPTEASPAPAVPDDLVAYAMSHSEQWAQEDALRAIQQSYDTWKDWNRVRAAMGIGRMG